MRVEQSTIIDVPINDVFGFVVNPENLPRWVSATREARQTSGGAMEVGATLAETTNVFGREMHAAYEVTEFDPPHRWRYRSVGDSFPSDWIYSFESTGTGTRLTLIIDHPRGALKVLGPIVGPIARRQTFRTLVELKHLLETEAKPTPTDA